VGENGVRLRQAVLAARDLDPVVERLGAELGLGEPFADPGVGAFGLRNAVFALGDTFLEVVSPAQEGTAAGRWLERRGGDCGYMLMFQLDDLDGARERARGLGVREVFEVDLDDIAEAHLHPADMRGAIVSLSRPRPPGAWRWGGPGWAERSAAGAIAGVEVAVADAEATAERWGEVLGVDPAEAGAKLRRDRADPGLREITISGQGIPEAVEIGGVRFEFVDGNRSC
jgi:glyoxalase-like protein